MKTIIMATAILFASVNFATAQTKTHHKKPQHHIKHTTAAVNKKGDMSDKMKGSTGMKTRTDKKK